MDVVYISSYMRSGSTILGLLISRYLGGVYVGEVRNAESLVGDGKRCNCGVKHVDCEFWSRVLRNIGGMNQTKQHSRFGTWPILAASFLTGSSSTGESAAKYFSSSSRAELAAAHEITRIYKAINNEHAPSFIVDSSHRTTQGLLLSSILRERLKVIRLVRDGRAVVASVMRRSGCDVATATKNWKQFNLSADHIQRCHPYPNNVLFLRYEDVVSSTAKELIKVSSILNRGFACDETESDYWVDSSSEHFLGGSPTAKKSQKTRLRLDERWKDELTDVDLNVFNEIAGKLNAKYGY